MPLVQVQQGQYQEIDVTTPSGQTVKGYVDGAGKLYISQDPNQPQQGQPQQGQPQQGQPQQGEEKTRHGAHPSQLLDIPKDLTFEKRLESTLKDNALNRDQHNLKRGKLDARRLHKVQEGSEAVFKAKKSTKGKKYNIALLIDESGSMSGERITKAAQLASFLAGSFQDIDVDLSVKGYSGHTESRKRFDEEVTPLQLQKRILGNYMGGGTYDLNALQETYQELHKREGDSIVIVLSDGEGDPQERITPLIERNKAIKTFAIGIQSDCKSYPVKAIVNNIDELKPTVLRILNSLIRRG